MLPRGNPILAVLALETGLCCAAKASLMLVPALGGARCPAPHLAAVFAFVGSQNCKRCSFWLSVSKAPASPPTSPAFSFFMDCSGLVSPAAQ